MNQYFAFYEVNAYLDFLGESYKSKLPPQIYKGIKSIADEYALAHPEEKINLQVFALKVK